MRIVHLELAGFYTKNAGYQTNFLTQQHLQDGHETIVISSNYCWDGAKVICVSPCDQIVENGLRLIRIPYCKLGPHILTKKIRKVKGLYELLEQLRPDVIFSHNTQYWSILDVIRYKKAHPEVKFYADTHTAAYNSGTNWLSLHVLHRVFYKYLVQKTLPHLEKYFYIGEGERQFSVKHYGVPEDRMEYYPLGGVLPTEEEYAERRARRRAELGVAEDEILLVHSGKLDALKRTDDLLRAFADVPGLKAKLAIIGSIPEDRKELLEKLMDEDNRVRYLGWKSGAELQEYLCACDLYCQPGSVSATMQNAVCCGSPIMAYPHEPYTKDLDYGNILWVETEEEMAEVFRQMEENRIDLSLLRDGSVRCAEELLDYRALAARLYR